jgi:iron complex outermembrane receptor protein
VTAYAGFEMGHSLRDLGQEGYVAATVGEANVVYSDWTLELGMQLLVVGPRRAADTTLVETGDNVVFDPYAVVDTFLATRAMYLVRGHETRASLRARNMLFERGPNPGFSGLEYPLPPGEIFLQLMHTY